MYSIEQIFLSKTTNSSNFKFYRKRPIKSFESTHSHIKPRISLNLSVSLGFEISNMDLANKQLNEIERILHFLK